jgi:hypothetical protein
MLLLSFVDRDMAMRFRGGGVGHTSTRAATNSFLSDRDFLDLSSSNEHDNVDEEFTQDANEGGIDSDEQEDWLDTLPDEIMASSNYYIRK